MRRSFGGEVMRIRVRWRLAGFVLCSVLAAVLLGSVGGASGAPIGNEQCNPTGRLFCITVSSFDGITASDSGSANGARYTWVSWSMRNSASSGTLTHPTIAVTLPDLPCANPAPDCGSSSTASFVLSTLQLPASGGSCSLKAGALVCTYPDLAAGANTGTTTIYFQTANSPATGTRLTVKGTVKERSNDANGCSSGDPNCDTYTATLDNVYEPDPNAAVTFALNGNRFHLATNDESSSFDFTWANTTKTLVTFKTLDAGTTYCFSDVPCFDRTLFADTAQATGFG